MEWLAELRYKAAAPRSLLDVGAHLGGFTRAMQAAAPGCVATLIEPNPHCHDALAATGCELHRVAASDRDGEAALNLTRDWPQSTGASLYREDTAFFRDEVLERVAVPRARLDDLFPGRRFDFVKIDTQGSELDVLRGGQAVLRRADHVLIEISLVEFNQGGARPEAVFAAMADLGFRPAQVTEFHRLRGVRDGALLQIDVLFERSAPRVAQQAWTAPERFDPGLLPWLAARVQRQPGFRVIKLEAPDWGALLAHTGRHGRFDFALCDGLGEPAMLLEMLPRIAEAGAISLAGGGPWSVSAGAGTWHFTPRMERATAAFTQLFWRGAISSSLSDQSPLVELRRALLTA
ncbi:MAG: FkbM family methyltransferase [Chitinophagaceae bacterium]|nr:FkbM family methyltransferase [Rubrivivax sp.]